MAVVAVCDSSPTTFGTDNGGPDETIRITAEPGKTKPFVGSCDRTVPACTVDEDWLTEPSTNPAPVMAAVAAGCVWPTTSGTSSKKKPDPITTFIADLATTEAPATGYCNMVLLPVVAPEDWPTEPGTSPAPMMAARVAAGVWPTRFGADTKAGGPEETTRFTSEPRFTEAPAIGFCDITEPADTVDEDWEAVVAVRPAPLMALRAAGCVWPATSGTDTNAGGPDDTTRFTVEPGTTKA
jgi:hypothetical protein